MNASIVTPGSLNFLALDGETRAALLLYLPWMMGQGSGVTEIVTLLMTLLRTFGLLKQTDSSSNPSI